MQTDGLTQLKDHYRGQKPLIKMKMSGCSVICFMAQPFYDQIIRFNLRIDLHFEFCIIEANYPMYRTCPDAKTASK